MIQVFTRSNNDDLYNLMRSLIPQDVECFKVTGFDDWWQAADYLYHIIDHGKDWVVNVDLDCFIFNWPSIMGLINYCNLQHFTHAGCRDGGELLGRSHSWVHMNPFFNVFHASKIRELRGDKPWPEISATKYNPEWDAKQPELPRPVNNDNDEPFAGFFYWLYEVGRPLFIESRLHQDGISTIVSNFAVHTWYSREFHYGHRDRIMAAFEAAKITAQVRSLTDPLSYDI